MDDSMSVKFLNDRKITAIPLMICFNINMASA